MHHTMKTHMLTRDEIDQLLLRTKTGSLATLNGDGSPYVTPVRYLYDNGSIYIHGLPKGQKIDNIKADPRVSMTVYEIDGLLSGPDGTPGDTKVNYQSVILSGRAAVLEDNRRKREVIAEIIKKYTPQLAGNHLPENMVKGTAVIEIQILTVTGKFYG